VPTSKGRETGGVGMRRKGLGRRKEGVGRKACGGEYAPLAEEEEKFICHVT